MRSSAEADEGTPVDSRKIFKFTTLVERGGFMASGEPKVAKIQTHFQALSEIAISLNTASDELTKVIGELDEALKKLNIGLSVWVTFASRGIEDWEFDDDQIGYTKIQGKWGIALRHMWGDHRDDSYFDEGPWLFNDGPRDLRLRSTDKIPDVIEALAKEAFDTTKNVQQKTQEVRELANVITKIANQPKVKSLSERIAAGEEAFRKSANVVIRRNEGSR